MKRLILTVLWLLLFPAALLHATATTGAYDYPFVNAYEATVIGTPSLYQAELPAEVPVKDYSLVVFEDREIPDVFWYSEGLKFSLVRQKERAPLIFVIAGTGASYQSPKVKGLQRAFYQAGFSVISISSPTHMNFIVNASSTKVPGHIIHDTEDLYRVMELAYQKVAARVDVSEFYLTGYSLGASQAAFLTRLDEQRQVFNFKKVLMINPSVSLFNSVGIIDQMLANTVGDEPGAFNSYLGRVIRAFATAFDRNEPLDFNEDFLYRVYKKKIPTEAALESLIGFSFRISSSNMIFTSDVMSGYGLLVPPGTQLKQTTPLVDYLAASLRISFLDYYTRYFYPFYHTKNPTLTSEQLQREMSLQSIAPYLRQTEKIAMMTNADDLILAPGEVDFLRDTFGERATIWPTGGHCGNMEQKDVVAFMVNYFKE
jgi:predicted alpha/beta-fold hydrolase